MLFLLHISEPFLQAKTEILHLQGQVNCYIQCYLMEQLLRSSYGGSYLKAEYYFLTIFVTFRISLKLLSYKNYIFESIFHQECYVQSLGTYSDSYWS